MGSKNHFDTADDPFTHEQSESEHFFQAAGSVHIDGPVTNNIPSTSILNISDEYMLGDAKASSDVGQSGDVDFKSDDNYKNINFIPSDIKTNEDLEKPSGLLGNLGIESSLQNEVLFRNPWIQKTMDPLPLIRNKSKN